jgi:transposase
MGRSRGGLTSKILAVVDTNGLPMRLALTAGEAHDNRLADKLLSRLKSGSMLLADRGYDADWIAPLQSHRADLLQPISLPSPQLGLNKIKHCRRIATRYDKLAAITSLSFIRPIFHQDQQRIEVKTFRGPPAKNQ